MNTLIHILCMTGCLSLLSGCMHIPYQKMLDAEVDALCAKDGGVKIYETVPLPPERFEKNGELKDVKFTRNENTLGPDYIYKSEETYLKGDPKVDPNSIGNAWLSRIHIRIYRRADGKLLGEDINYWRVGGGPTQWSSGLRSVHSCLRENKYGLIERLFVNTAKEEQR